MDDTGWFDDMKADSRSRKRERKESALSRFEREAVLELARLSAGEDGEASWDRVTPELQGQRTFGALQAAFPAMDPVLGVGAVGRGGNLATAFAKTQACDVLNELRMSYPGGRDVGVVFDGRAYGLGKYCVAYLAARRRGSGAWLMETVLDGGTRVFIEPLAAMFSPEAPMPQLL